jgi:hypothetical protein
MWENKRAPDHRLPSHLLISRRYMNVAWQVV